MTQVKGTLLRGALKFVKHRKHPAGIPGVVATLGPAAAPTFARPILSGEWYPYAAYRELLAAIERDVAGGDPEVVVALGRFAARQDLSGVFKIISVMASVPRILQSSSVFWSRYCDTGRFEISDLTATSGTGRIHDFPDMSAEHERSLRGWIEGIGIAAGAKTAEVTLSRSRHRGDPFTEYSMRWTT
jgi:hypothetical protein